MDIHDVNVMIDGTAKNSTGMESTSARAAAGTVVRQVVCGSTITIYDAVAASTVFVENLDFVRKAQEKVVFISKNGLCLAMEFVAVVIEAPFLGEFGDDLLTGVLTGFDGQQKLQLIVEIENGEEEFLTIARAGA